MSGKLERIKWQMYSFINDDATKKKFNEVYEEVVRQNQNNIEAFVPIGYFEKEGTNIGNLDYLEDYEILTGSYKDSEGNYWNSEDEYKAHIEEKAEKKFDEYSVVEDDNGQFVIKDSDGEDVESFDDEDEANEKLEEMKQEWIDDNTEDLQYEYDEIYWNYVIKFDADIDIEVAQKVGLGVLQITNEDREDDGEKYLFLQTCGMDMSPKYMAYQALAHGCISEEYLGQFRETNLDYTKYVVGSSFNEVIEELGIAEMVKEKMEKAKLEKTQG